MSKSIFKLIISVVFGFLWIGSAFAKDKPKNSQLAEPPPEAASSYLTDWESVVKMSHDQWGALKKERKALVNSEPVSLETDVRPFVKIESYPDEKKPLSLIFISVGFVDLVNNLAHAKAIDKIEKGYFEKYVALLAQESGDKELAPLPHLDNPKFWSEDIMNEQLSNFNSIVGIVVGVNMAYHYLGQFSKHEKQIMDAAGNNATPINTVLSSEEYEAAFKAGLRNALDAGCAIEGAVPFFEAFDKMKVRPSWTAFFLPSGVKFSKLRKTLEKTQNDFFAGRSE